jgi:mannose-6-phosphate isomerase-like protein (cupin superfamily)
MSTFQPINTLQESPEVQCDILYATPLFEVRLWSLQSGQQLSHTPNTLIKESQCLIIDGTAQVSSAKQQSQPEKGKRFILNGSEAWTLSANSKTLLLELRWGQNLTAKPLHEITEERPWGSFTVLKDEPAYKMKQLSVKPGNRLSLQRHFKREEHWLITHGQPEVTLDNQTHRLHAGEYIHIPLQSWHRITNPEGATEHVEIIELQLGNYFGEDDIERSQDDYGRQ